MKKGYTMPDTQKNTEIYVRPVKKQQFPQAEITGHRDLPGVHKDCPCFSVKNEFKTKQV